MERLNHDMGATNFIGHTSMSASYTKPAFFLKDGGIYNGSRRGKKERREFYQLILDVLAVLGR